MANHVQKRAWRRFVVRLVLTGVFGVLAGITGSLVITGIMLMSVWQSAKALAHLLGSYEP